MTTRPRLADFDRSALAGLAAVALFVLMAAVFVTARFDNPDGFAADVSIVKGIGFALFDISGGVESEGFLAAFEIIDIVLVAALVGAVMLARRDEGDSVFEIVADGGRLRGSGDAPGDATDAGDGSGNTDAATTGEGTNVTDEGGEA